MFMGEYRHSIDAKGRLIVPARFRESLGDVFVVTKGLDGCLWAFADEDWKKLEEKLRALPLSDKEARRFSRFFLAGAGQVEVDKQGRINIPQNLREYAGLSKDCTVIGVSSRIEIWDSASWEDFYTESEENFEDIAEDLIDFDL